MSKDRVRSEQSVHWNGNLLCSIDIETTGLNPEKDDLLEIAIVPLTPHLTVSKVLMPYDLVITPKDPDIYKSNQILLPGMTLSDVMLQGFDWSVAAELLESWKEALNLPEGKKIIPLGHNYRGFDEKWIRATLGDVLYEYIFDYHVRDTMEIGLYLNDMADYLQEPIPFPKVGLTYMCACAGVVNSRRHRALGDAMATAELYRLLTTKLGPTLRGVSQLLQCPVEDSDLSRAAIRKGLKDSLPIPEESSLLPQSTLDDSGIEKAGQTDSADSPLMVRSEDHDSLQHQTQASVYATLHQEQQAGLQQPPTGPSFPVQDGVIGIPTSGDIPHTKASPEH